MINLDLNKQNTIVIPLTGVSELFPPFTSDFYIKLEKIIGGNTVVRECTGTIDKCNETATIEIPALGSKTKEGQYAMRVYIKEINKVFLTLVHIKNGISSRRN